MRAARRGRHSFSTHPIALSFACVILASCASSAGSSKATPRSTSSRPTTSTSTTTAVTTPTTIPGPSQALGTQAQLNGQPDTSANVTVRNIINPAVPVPAYTTATTLQNAPTQWIGADISVTNLGHESFGDFAGPAPQLGFTVNRVRVPLMDSYGFGTSGCPRPDLLLLRPNQTTTGCVALPVPEGTTVVAVGIVLDIANGPPLDSAQWAVK